MFNIAIPIIPIGFTADTFYIDMFCSDRFHTDTFHINMFCLCTKKINEKILMSYREDFWRKKGIFIIILNCDPQKCLYQNCSISDHN
jgi:hypothetical protein